MLKDFKQFLLRGNVVDLAVGVVIGAAFNSVIQGLVTDLITPFISAVAHVPDFSDLVFTVNGGVFKMGAFLNALISFLITATVVFFFIVKPVNLLVSHSHEEPPPDPTTRKCPHCLSEIPIGAKRCRFCTQLV